MILGLLIALVILWFLGYIHISALPIPDIVLFSLNNRPITLWDLLIFFVIMAVIGVLPTPLRQVAFIVFVLWVLSTLGILSIVGLPLASILVIAIIIGLVVSLFGLV